MDPQTPEQWQEAVNLARFYALLHASRAYGLVTGGPEIDVDRCLDLLHRAEERGILPQEAEVDRIITDVARTGVFP